ncbi:MAG: DUF5399 family protein [Chlamydiales bacterium]|nr:DUF5399 family protein [Chlamydiales bacterium]
MKATTIDNLDIKTHERYAQDQQSYDKNLLLEASNLSQHFEVVGTSQIYVSKWADLFEMGANNQSWAAFSPPPTEHRQANRFFSFCILPSIPLIDEVENEGEGKESDDQEEEQDEPEHELIQRAMQIQKAKNQDSFLFERDKSSIINLLQTVTHLNRLLGQINSRKLQYQKG